MREEGVCYAIGRSTPLAERTNPPPGGALPPTGKPPTTGVHAMRRGGARREVTERVTLRSSNDGRVLEGWALNVSRRGLRAILEERVVLGQKFDIGVGTDDAIRRPGRIVWVQEEPDGVIVGIEFTSTSETSKSVPPPPPGAESVTDLADDESDKEEP